MFYVGFGYYYYVECYFGIVFEDFYDVCVNGIVFDY